MIRNMILAVTLGHLMIFSTIHAQERAPRSLEQMIKQLGSTDTAATATEAILEYCERSADLRDKAVEALLEVAKTNDSEILVQRGWAIAALASIGGQDIDESLLNIHADEKQESVVRSWAAAARVRMTKTTAGLIEKANLINQFPALGRPIGMRLVDHMTEGDGAGVEDVIGVTIKVPTLAQALAPAIMAFESEELINVMVTAKDQNIRNRAAAYVATKASQGEGGLAEPVIEICKFNAQADEVPWKGGPLFLPSIAWGKEDAKDLVGNLMRWLVFSDQQDDSANIQIIHNNIRSLGLANAAGYQSPGWNDVGTTQWLIAWGKAFGKDEVSDILSEQGIEESEYSEVFDELD